MSEIRIGRPMERVAAALTRWTDEAHWPPDAELMSSENRMMKTRTGPPNCSHLRDADGFFVQLTNWNGAPGFRLSDS